MNETFTMYFADVCGNPQNCQYPHKGTATTPEELKRCMAQDHVFIRFKGNYRNSKNFEEAVTAVFDCDNDFAEDAAKWISPEDISRLFPSVSCVVSTSRHHMKQKGGKSPRPRFHVIFVIDPITAPTEYTAFMKSVQQMYPFFDDNALDAARFFFGNPDTDVIFFDGNTTLNKFIEEESAERAFAELGETITEGSRNNTMSLFAGKLLKRLGNTDEAHRKFLERAESCDPPLEDSELETIWQSARKFYKKVSTQPGYVSPDDYNAPAQIKWETPIPFEKADLPTFPTEALPKVVRNYVTAVAESTQTPVDMSASAALAILALCEQGKFRIRGKCDWTEPLNLFVVVVAEPSERKSAVISLMTRPVNTFEADYNRQNAAELETSKMNKRILERRQRALEDKAAKGKVEDGELEQFAQQLAAYKEKTPLRLYVDDVTTEKLTAVLADGGGKAAIVSAEGGIFDMLSGIYSKNVNIDVSENVTWGQRKRFADGRVSMPYKQFLGYRKGADGLPEIVPEEAEIVRTIYRMFIEGTSTGAIAKHLTDNNVPTPAGKTVWQRHTIESILQNEKYKGSALLQKKYTVDFLQKKMKVNEGEVPQYYVEHSHSAIIAPEEWERVQLELKRRKDSGKRTISTSPFAGKLLCGDCGEIFGSKVWHSNSKYRRIIWQCNAKFKGDKKCTTLYKRIWTLADSK